MDLIGFLRARLDEDEAVARAAARGLWQVEHGWVMAGKPGVIVAAFTHAYTDASSDDLDPSDADHIARWDPARVLAEVEAKRQRVRTLADLAADCPADDWPESGAMHLAVTADLARHLLLIVVQPYADHADFAPAWLAASPGRV